MTISYIQLHSNNSTQTQTQYIQQWALFKRLFPTFNQANNQIRTSQNNQYVRQN